MSRFVLMVVVALGGCYVPDLPDCAIACTAETGCPDGFACTAGVCRADGATASCGGEGGGDDGGGTTRRVAVALTGTGRGTVASTPAGLACTDACEAELATGAVTLAALPADGSTFAGWTGDCTGMGACVVDGAGDVAVTAAFDACTPSHGTRTFAPSGDVEAFVVPPCTAAITIDARGGAGGRGSELGTSLGTVGKGGKVVATIAVAAGDTFTVRVGLSGTSRAGGYNGGADGGEFVVSFVEAGGGGGGASDVRRNGDTLDDRIVVAGGGGGAAVCLGDGERGAAGGGLSGANVASTCLDFTRVAKGGTATAGGLGGVYDGGTDDPPSNGVAGQRGRGGAGGPDSGGGGGGGGYFGGGGGTWHGGGGGSSYAIATATAVTHTQGAQSGDGQVIITW